MEVLRDDFKAIVVLLDAEVGHGEVAVDGEGRGAVFEDAVGGVFVAEEARVEDCEAVGVGWVCFGGAADDGFGVGGGGGGEGVGFAHVGCSGRLCDVTGVLRKKDEKEIGICVGNQKGQSFTDEATAASTSLWGAEP